MRVNNLVRVFFILLFLAMFSSSVLANSEITFGGIGGTYDDFVITVRDDIQNKLIVGASVTLLNSSLHNFIYEGDSVTLTTDSNGQVRFNNLTRNDEYGFDISANGYKSKTSNLITLDTTPKNIEKFLVPDSKINIDDGPINLIITISDSETGSPLEDVEVVLLNATDDPFEEFIFNDRNVLLLTNSDGQVHFGNLSTNYDYAVNANKNGYYQITSSKYLTGSPSNPIDLTGRTLSLNPDELPPSIFLTSFLPQNYDVVRDGDYLTISSIAENHIEDELTVVLYIDGNPLFTEVVSSGGTVPFTYLLGDDGKYEWYLNVSDSAGNWATTDIYTFFVDSEPPEILNVTIGQDYAIYGDNVEVIVHANNSVNVTFEDFEVIAQFIGASDPVHLDYVGGTEWRGFLEINNQNNLVSTLSLSAEDLSGNIATNSLESVVIINNPPLIEIEDKTTPANQSMIYDVSVGLDINFSLDDGLEGYNLPMNTTLYFSHYDSEYIHNESKMVEGSNHYTLTTGKIFDLPGLYQWFLEVQDPLGNSMQSEVWNFYLNSSPQVMNYSVVNQFIRSDSIFDFWIHANDSYSDNINVSLLFYDGLNSVFNISKSDHTNDNYSITFTPSSEFTEFRDMNYTIEIILDDGLGNYTFLKDWFVIDDTPPIINDINFSSQFAKKDDIIELDVVIEDNFLFNPENFTLSVQVDYTDSSVNHLTYQGDNLWSGNFTIEYSGNTDTFVNLTIYDLAGNIMSKNYTFGIYNSLPSINASRSRLHAKYGDIITLSAELFIPFPGYYDNYNVFVETDLLEGSPFTFEHIEDNLWEVELLINTFESSNGFLNITALDPAGNVAYNNSLELIIDNIAPIITINAPNYNQIFGGGNLEIDTYQIDIGISISEESNSTYYYSAGNTNILGPGDSYNFPITLDYPGKYEIVFFANDSAGNKGTDSLIFYGDFGFNRTKWLNRFIANDDIFNAELEQFYYIFFEPVFVNLTQDILNITDEDYNHMLNFSLNDGKKVSVIFDPYESKMSYNLSAEYNNPNFVESFEYEYSRAVLDFVRFRNFNHLAKIDDIIVENDVSMTLSLSQEEFENIFVCFDNYYQCHDLYSSHEIDFILIEDIAHGIQLFINLDNIENEFISFLLSNNTIPPRIEFITPENNTQFSVPFGNEVLIWVNEDSYCNYSLKFEDSLLFQENIFLDSFDDYITSFLERDEDYFIELPETDFFGNHTLLVTCTDEKDNYATYEFAYEVLDIEPPIVTLLDISDTLVKYNDSIELIVEVINNYNISIENFNVSARLNYSDANIFELKYIGENIWGTNISIGHEGDGTYNLNITAEDISGNIGWNDSINIEIDNTNPIIIVDNPFPGSFISAQQPNASTVTVNFRLNISESFSDLFYIYLDDHFPVLNHYNGNFDRRIIYPGRYEVEFYVYDNAGNIGYNSTFFYGDFLFDSDSWLENLISNNNDVFDSNIFKYSFILFNPVFTSLKNSLINLTSTNDNYLLAINMTDGKELFLGLDFFETQLENDFYFEYNNPDFVDNFIAWNSLEPVDYIRFGGMDRAGQVKLGRIEMLYDTPYFDELYICHDDYFDCHEIPLLKTDDPRPGSITYLDNSTEVAILMKNHQFTNRYSSIVLVNDTIPPAIDILNFESGIELSSPRNNTIIFEVNKESYCSFSVFDYYDDPIIENEDINLGIPLEPHTEYSFDLPGLPGLGEMSLLLSCIDSRGNEGLSHSNFILVDSIPPNITDVFLSNDIFRFGDEVEIIIEAEDYFNISLNDFIVTAQFDYPDSIKYNLDFIEWGLWGKNISINYEEDIFSVLNVTIEDISGNLAWNDTIVIEIKNSAPEIMINYPVNLSTLNFDVLEDSTATINFTLSHESDSVFYSYLGHDYTLPNNMEQEFDINLNYPGRHFLEIFAVDVAGNIGYNNLMFYANFIFDSDSWVASINFNSVGVSNIELLNTTYESGLLNFESLQSELINITDPNYNITFNATFDSGSEFRMIFDYYNSYLSQNISFSNSDIDFINQFEHMNTREVVDYVRFSNLSMMKNKDVGLLSFIQNSTEFEDIWMCLNDVSDCQEISTNTMENFYYTTNSSNTVVYIEDITELNDKVSFVLSNNTIPPRVDFIYPENMTTFSSPYDNEIKFTISDRSFCNYTIINSSGNITSYGDLNSDYIEPHQENLFLLPNPPHLIGEYTLSIFCVDEANNNSTNIFNFIFEDNLPINITNILPTEGRTFPSSTSSVTLELETSKPSFCRYKHDAPLSNFSDGISMDYTGTDYHAQNIVVSPSTSENIYFLCMDYNGNLSAMKNTFFFINAVSSTSSGGDSAPSSSPPPPRIESEDSDGEDYVDDDYVDDDYIEEDVVFYSESLSYEKINRSEINLVEIQNDNISLNRFTFSLDRDTESIGFIIDAFENIDYFSRDLPKLDNVYQYLHIKTSDNINFIDLNDLRIELVLDDLWLLENGLTEDDIIINEFNTLFNRWITLRDYNYRFSENNHIFTVYSATSPMLAITYIKEESPAVMDDSEDDLGEDVVDDTEDAGFSFIPFFGLDIITISIITLVLFGTITVLYLFLKKDMFSNVVKSHKIKKNKKSNKKSDDYRTHDMPIIQDIPTSGSLTLDDYLSAISRNVWTRGFADNQIRIDLMRANWPADKIVSAYEYIESYSEGKSSPPDPTIKPIVDYMIAQIAHKHGHSREEIMDALSSLGWPKSSIQTALTKQSSGAPLCKELVNHMTSIDPNLKMEDMVRDIQDVLKDK